jgi:hypothetical protein
MEKMVDAEDLPETLCLLDGKHVAEEFQKSCQKCSPVSGPAKNVSSQEHHGY